MKKKNPYKDKPYANPNSVGNIIRPNIKCLGCGTLGCVTYWGPWCFKCNVKRMDRINKKFDKISENIKE